MRALQAYTVRPFARTSVLAAIGGGMLALGASARAEPPPAELVHEEVVVVTGTRIEEAQERSPVRTDVVTRKEIARRGARTVADALAMQPGVTMNPGAYGFLGGVGAVQIQGFDRERVLVLEDGERVVGDVGGAIDLFSIPTTDLERIEVVRGPTSALYGASAIGGVVGLVTAPPAQLGPSGRLLIEGRTPAGLVTQGQAAYREGVSFLGADFQLSMADAVERVPGEPTRSVPSTSRRLVGLRAGTILGDHLSLRMRARWIRDDAEGLEAQATPGLGTYLIDLPQTTDRVAVQGIVAVSIGASSSVRLSAARQWVLGDSDRRFRDSPVAELRHRDYALTSSEGTLTLEEGPRTWIAGGRVEHEGAAQTLDKIASGAAGLTHTEVTEVAPLSRTAGAVYGQLLWRFLDDRVALVPGVRQEIDSRDGLATAPRLAVSVRPTDALTLRASAGRGYRAPSAKELGFVFDHSVYGYRVEGNPALRPETSIGGNADMGLDLGPVVFDAGGFANWIDQLIDLDLAAGTSTGGVQTYRYVNFGEARTLGAHGGVRVLAGSRVRTEARYDYLYTRDEERDRPLGGRPPHTVTASAELRLPGELLVTARWRFQTSAFVDTDVRSPAFHTLDARIARPILRSVAAHVGVQNALDERQEPGRAGDVRSPIGRVIYLGIVASLPSEDEG